MVVDAGRQAANLASPIVEQHQRTVEPSASLKPSFTQTRMDPTINLPGICFQGCIMHVTVSFVTCPDVTPPLGTPGVWLTPIRQREGIRP